MKTMNLSNNNLLNQLASKLIDAEIEFDFIRSNDRYSMRIYDWNHDEIIMVITVIKSKLYKDGLYKYRLWDSIENKAFKEYDTYSSVEQIFDFILSMTDYGIDCFY